MSSEVPVTWAQVVQPPRVRVLAQPLKRYGGQQTWAKHAGAAQHAAGNSFAGEYARFGILRRQCLPQMVARRSSRLRGACSYAQYGTLRQSRKPHLRQGKSSNELPTSRLLCRACSVVNAIPRHMVKYYRWQPVSIKSARRFVT